MEAGGSASWTGVGRDCRRTTPRACVLCTGAPGRRISTIARASRRDGTRSPGGARRVIVDLSKVTFIDSTALGVLVSGAKRVRPRNGNLDIVCADENIIRIFEITGLDRIFGIYPSRGEAVKAAGH
jgi:anti-anti-sigma regulatory factor